MLENQWYDRETDRQTDGRTDRHHLAFSERESEKPIVPSGKLGTLSQVATNTHVAVNWLFADPVKFRVSFDARSRKDDATSVYTWKNMFPSCRISTSAQNGATRDVRVKPGNGLGKGDSKGRSNETKPFVDIYTQHVHMLLK